MASLLDHVKIERLGLERHFFQELYHTILKISWPKFLGLLVLSDVLINIFFASLFLAGGNCITNARPGSFFDAFVFSNQTFATIGYGYLLPGTEYAHIVVVAESMCGIIFMAIVTGLTFAKFSRPTTNVIFSRKAVIVDHDGVPTLMFRIGNGRDTNIVDAKLSVNTLLPYISQEGIVMQKFADIKLVRNHNPFFTMTWTVLHKIDSTSPFYGMNYEDFNSNKISIYISLIGFDETFSQTVHTAWRYNFDHIHFSKKFKDVIEILPDGTRRIHFNDFHEVL